MRSARFRGLIALATVAALVGLVYVLVLVWRTKGLSGADQLASVVSGLTAAAVFLPRIRRWIVFWHRNGGALSDLGVLPAADGLAKALRLQWEDEATLRRVNDPRPLPVRWLNATGHGKVPAEADQFRDIAVAFAATPARRLVILGPAGAGKTVLATKLALDLVRSRQPGGPVPVVLSAASWGPALDLREWITQQLVRDQPWLGDRIRMLSGSATTLATALVDDGLVIPIIDGLDELPPSGRVAAINGVNAAGSELPIVVTSRPDEYADAIATARAISLAVVIELLPLDVPAIKQYLAEATGSAPNRWSALFDRMDADAGEPITAALGTPLMLWLARTVYESTNADTGELLAITTAAGREGIERHLLDALVPAVYATGRVRSGRAPFRCGPRQAQRWLAFLAAHLKVIGESDLAWWRLSDSQGGTWLAGVAIRAAALGGVACFLAVRILDDHGDWRGGRYAGPLPFRDILLGGPLGRQLRGPAGQILDSVPSAIRNAPDAALASASAGLLFAYTTGAALLAVLAVTAWNTPAELRWSWPRMARAVSGRVVAPVLVGAALLLLCRAWALDQPPDLGGLLRASSTWLALLAVFLAGVSTLPAALVTTVETLADLTAADLLARDRYAARFVAFTRNTMMVVTIALFGAADLAAAAGVFAVAAVVVPFGPGRASRAYEGACIWFAAARRLPWRTMPFLVDAHRRGVLRRSGAVYRFRHNLLQEHLAAQHPTPWRARLPMVGTRHGGSRRLVATEHPVIDVSIPSDGDATDALIEQRRIRVDADRLAELLSARVTPSLFAGASLRFAFGGSAAARRYLGRRIGDFESTWRRSGAEWTARRGWPRAWELPPLGEEKVLFSTRRHFTRAFDQFSYGLLATLSFGWLTGYLIKHHVQALAYAVAGTWVLVMLLVGQRLAGWYTTTVVLTDRRLLGITGIVFRSFTCVPLPAISRMRFVQSFLGRAFGYGSLVIDLRPGTEGVSYDQSAIGRILRFGRWEPLPTHDPSQIYWHHCPVIHAQLRKLLHEPPDASPE